MLLRTLWRCPRKWSSHSASMGVRHDTRSFHLYLLLSFLLLDVDMSHVIKLMCTCVCLHLLCVSHDQGHMCSYSLCLIWSAHLCMHVSKLSQVPYDEDHVCICMPIPFLYVQFHECMHVYTSSFTVSFPSSRIKNIYMRLRFKALCFLINREVHPFIHLMILIEILS